MRFYILFFLFPFVTFSQVSGVVTDTDGNNLPFVNVYVENSTAGTTTNGEGFYELELDQSWSDKTVTLTFQFLGYTTVNKEITLKEKQVLDITLVPETTSLDEVVVTAGVNPADAIVKAAIAKRKENLNAISSYTASFYSRGLWQVKDAPEKILGQEVGDLGGALDSTRTGVIYLSETLSDIAYERPNNFSEKIKASKVSGDDNGFSFNTAIDANFSFYENTIDLNVQMLSPIATNAFTNYTYKLEGTFIENNQIINKISVTPKRPKDKVFTGTIYIVEDEWQLYGVDLKVTGEVIQVPVVKDLNFKQSFKYDKTQRRWIKISQVIDFSFGFFGFNGDGRFIAAYSDYNFAPQFEKASFSNEVLSFEPEANKKDSLFWINKRPVPLTTVEQTDYIKKDSIQVIRKSQKHLDSVDARGNKFKVWSPVMGYTFRNTYKRYSFTYDGLISNVNFNTVQGWHGGTGFNYFNWSDDDYQKTFYAFAKANYAFSEDRLRYTVGISRRFNRTNRSRLSVTAGVETRQFNAENPISENINTITSLYYERNYLKIYERSYAEAAYSQEIFNGLRGFLNVAYEDRKALSNTTDQTWYPKDDIVYTSNNPLDPLNEGTLSFEDHQIVKAQLTAQINFGQKYYNYPTGKFNISSDRYPTVFLTYETGLGASQEQYNFNQLRIRLRHGFNIGNKGRFNYNIKAGTFLNDAGDISFVDYQHFNGNQTRIGTEGTYINRFNLLPYYERSTNNNYLEAHAEHDFKGWVLGKIPGLNAFNFNLVVGGHVLSTVENKPYTEWSIGLDNLGWGKYRFLRLDYVRSNGLDKPDGAFIFGLKFLDLF